MVRKGYAGGAITAALTSNITNSDLSIPISVATGWPTGVLGAEPFVIVLERGGPGEEKVLVEQRSGTTLTVSSRGYDNTVGVAHAVGSSVEHCIDANTIQEANAHVNDDTRDDHSQYLDNARHDIEARHTFGAAYGTPATPAATSTAAAAGSGNNPAKEDHVHDIGVGSIDAANLFAAGVVDSAAIATDAVGSAEIATDAVGSDEIAAGAVGNTELATNAVTLAKMDNLSVGTSELIDLSVTNAKLGLLAVDAGNIASNAVTTTKINNDAVQTAKILDQAVTEAKLNPSVLLAYGGTWTRSTNQNIPNNTMTAISFTTAPGSPTPTAGFTGGLPDTTFTIPGGGDGTYAISATCEWTVGITNIVMEVLCDAVSYQDSQNTSAVGATGSSTGIVLRLAAGAVVQIRVKHANGTQDITSARFDIWVSR